MGSGTKTMNMDKPPPYEAHQGSNNPAYSYPVQDAKWQDGYSKPGYAYDTSYTATKNAENSQAYNPPIVSNIDYSSEVNPNFYSTQSAKSSSKKTAVGDGAQCDTTIFGASERVCSAKRLGFVCMYRSYNVLYSDHGLLQRCTKNKSGELHLPWHIHNMRELYAWDRINLL